MCLRSFPPLTVLTSALAAVSLVAITRADFDPNKRMDAITAETRTAEFAPTSETLERALSNGIKDRSLLCQFNYLIGIGWRVIESPTGNVEIIDGRPCDRGSPTQAALAGDMTIALPKNPKQADFDLVIKEIPGLMKSDSTVCGYKLKVAVASKTAIDKLKKNSRNYQFVRPGPFQGRLGFIDLEPGAARELGWEPPTFMSIWGAQALKPRSSGWSAIESFYTMKARTECMVGLQLAEFAVQKELYGKENFDQAFPTEQIVIGTWEIVKDSKSATRGSEKGRVFTDKFGKLSAILGGASLVGRTGYFGNVFGEAYLDNKPNRGENLIVASITPEASLEFRRAGSVEPFNRMLRDAWELRNANTKLDKVRDKHLIARNEEKVQEILKNPFLSGVMTHTHPYSRYYSYSKLFEIVYAVNPRTPYYIKFYDDVVNYGLFDRHSNYMVNKCISSQ